MNYFVVPYFGPLPNYFQLWLNSCGYNPSFHWLLITDQDISSYSVPKNVFVKTSNLEEVKNIFETYLKQKINLKTAYKLCDYRPVFWILLDFHKIEYNFWGYCDTDVIFGNLSKFITEEILTSHHKIFNNGHLSLFSADEIIKHAFLLLGSKKSWHEIMKTEENFGFDEHHGINKIFKNQQFTNFNGDENIADILPNYSKIILVIPSQNKKNQIFFYEKGHIFKSYEEKGKTLKEEMCYIHFQKRKMFIEENLNLNEFLITSTGFYSIKKENIDAELDKKLTSREHVALAKNTLRFYKNKVKK